MQFTLPSPAKLNLFLHITGRRDDGYHELQTIFQLLDYNDTLHFTLEQEHDEIHIESALNIPTSQNLIWRAAKLLQTYTQTRLGAHIQLNKQLPIGGGIGGGSSNAATTLLGLNRLWQTQLDTDTLAELGRQLGADVPVFVRGHSAWAEGIGEILTPVILQEQWYVVLVPPCEVATQKMFSHPNLPRNTPKMTMQAFQSGKGHNDFELLASQLYPEIKEGLTWLGQFNAARMTGSGSCIFTSFSTEEEALKVVEKIQPPYYGFAAKGLNVSTLI